MRIFLDDDTHFVFNHVDAKLLKQLYITIFTYKSLLKEKKRLKIESRECV